MAPDASLQRQNEYYRKMTGEMRFQIALDLHAFSSKLARGSLSAAAQREGPRQKSGTSCWIPSISGRRVPGGTRPRRRGPVGRCRSRPSFQRPRPVCKVWRQSRRSCSVSVVSNDPSTSPSRLQVKSPDRQRKTIPPSPIEIRAGETLRREAESARRGIIGAAARRAQPDAAND